MGIIFTKLIDRKKLLPICVVFILMSMWTYTYLSVDWDEVHEYEEEWGGKITGQCPPQRPYMYHTLILILIPFILFMYIFTYILIFYCDKHDKHEDK